MVRGTLREVARQALRRHQAEDVWQMGAALAFYVMVSVAPLIYFSLLLLGAVFGADAARNDVFMTLVSVAGERTARTVQGIVAAAASDSGWGFSLFGMAILFYTASSMFNHLRRTLNRLWGTSEPIEPVGEMVLGRWFALLFTLVIQLLLVVLFFLQMVATAFLSLTARLIPAFSATLLNVGDTALSFAAAWLLIVLIFRLLPRGRMAWRVLLPGAALTAALFVIGKLLLSVYLRYSTASTFYGAAGSLLILMIWVFYIAQTFYIGAVVTAVWAERARSGG